jgi:serine/threonine protein kinase
MAPEVLLNGHISKAADVYSFGITLWELFTGCHAYHGETRMAAAAAALAAADMLPHSSSLNHTTQGTHVFTVPQVQALQRQNDVAGRAGVLTA